MHYDGNYRDTSSPLHIKFLEIPSHILRWMFVPIFRRIGSGAKILYYHEIEEEEFRSHIKYLKKHYNIVPLGDIVTKVDSDEPISNKNVAIVFDDGRRSLYSNVFPVVKEYNIPVTVYLVTDAINEGVFLWDKINALQQVCESPGSVDELATINPEKRYQFLEQNLVDQDITFERTALNWSEIIEMNDAGVNFQCHTKTHPSLPALDRETIEREITESTDMIEAKLDAEVNHFSYPFGHNSNKVIQVLQEHGFKSAVGVESGVNTRESNVHDLRRVGVETTSVHLLATLMEGVWHSIVPGKTFLTK